MGYMKAEDILPLEIVELIQQYIDGANIYIPRKQEHKQKRRTETSYQCELHRRNQLIYQDYLSGLNTGQLASRYYLSVKSIQRIIRAENKCRELTD